MCVGTTCPPECETGGHVPGGGWRAACSQGLGSRSGAAARVHMAGTRMLATLVFSSVIWGLYQRASGITSSSETPRFQSRGGVRSQRKIMWMGCFSHTFPWALWGCPYMEVIHEGGHFSSVLWETLNIQQWLASLGGGETWENRSIDV